MEDIALEIVSRFLLDLAETDLSLQVVLLIDEGDGFSSLWAKSADETSGIYLLIEGGIDSVSSGELVDLVALVD